MTLTDMQQRVIHEIKTGKASPVGYPRNYDGGTPELDAAKSLEELGLVYHSGDQIGQYRSPSPVGWHLTAEGIKLLQVPRGESA